MMYATLGISALAFILHGILLYGWSVQNRRMSLHWIVLMGGLNLVGAAIYAARVSFGTSNCIPEKWYPQRFDFCGSSHQILHIMVILAGLAHMFGLFHLSHLL
jgi:adiponectin receptor